MILLIYLICVIPVFYILFFAKKVKKQSSEQSKKETEELKTEWINFIKKDIERCYPNKYKDFFND